MTNRQKTIDRYGNVMYSDFDVIKRNEIGKLTAHELLYYCLANPCSFYQNCNMGGGFPNDGKTYITRDFPSEEAARFISPLQEKSLKKLKDSITIVLAEGLKDMDVIDIEYLDIAERANLTGLIPVLAPKADLKKNPYIYTLFYNLMNHNDYKYFQHSAYYKKTFDDYTKSGPRGEVQVEQAEADQLTAFALKFYQHTQRAL